MEQDPQSRRITGACFKKKNEDGAEQILAKGRGWKRRNEAVTRQRKMKPTHEKLSHIKMAPD